MLNCTSELTFGNHKSLFDNLWFPQVNSQVLFNIYSPARKRAEFHKKPYVYYSPARKRAEFHKKSYVHYSPARNRVESYHKLNRDINVRLYNISPPARKRVGLVFDLHDTYNLEYLYLVCHIEFLILHYMWKFMIYVTIWVHF